MYSRSLLYNSSKATNWYNHPCYDNITLTAFEGSEISRSEAIPFAQFKNIAWTRNLVLEIASKVHYLVLFFLHSRSFFLHLNSFYLMPCNRHCGVNLKCIFKNRSNRSGNWFANNQDYVVDSSKSLFSFTSW